MLRMLMLISIALFFVTCGDDVKKTAETGTPTDATSEKIAPPSDLSVKDIGVKADSTVVLKDSTNTIKDSTQKDQAPTHEQPQITHPFVSASTSVSNSFALLLDTR